MFQTMLETNVYKTRENNTVNDLQQDVLKYIN